MKAEHATPPVKPLRPGFVVQREAPLPASFVDLAFVLAFVFMLLAALSARTSVNTLEHGLPVAALPTAAPLPSGAKGQEAPSVYLTLLADGSFHWDSEAVRPAEELATVLSRPSPGGLSVRAASDVPYGMVARALDAATRAGHQPIRLTYLTTPATSTTSNPNP